MNRMSITRLALAIALAPAAFAHAQDSSLLSAAASDTVLRRVVSNAAPTPPGVERAPVQFAWALDADAGPITAPAPYTAVSREHWRDVDGAALATGIAIETTAPGALVLISPADAAAHRATPDAVQIRQAGRALPAAESIVALAPQAALEAATGAQFAPGALGFRVNPMLGAGRFDLQLANAEGRYVIHVREPDSPVSLRVDSPASGYHTGERVRLQASLDSTAAPAQLREIGGMLLAPDGRDFPLQVVRADNGVDLEVVLPAEAATAPGLWEAHVLASGESGGHDVLRDAKVAFEVVAPTARLQGRQAARAARDGSLSFDLPVEVGSAGRYEVRAVLYGTGRDGRMGPLAVAHSANWLEPGNGSLQLQFPADVIAGSRAPYELRQLGLHDQGRMGRLEYRERAALLSRSPGGKQIAR